MSRTNIYQFLSGQRLGVLAYSSLAGHSRSALVGIAITPEMEIIFDTVDSSRKAECLVAESRCSFVIGWTGEVTVQLEGRAHRPEASELLRYRALYFDTWPDGRKRLSWAGIRHFVVRPTWIRYSDFDQTPPLIEELTF